MTRENGPHDSKETDKMLNGTELEPEVYLDPKIQAAIGKALRSYSADIVSAPIPDKFLALLARLEAMEEGGK